MKRYYIGIDPDLERSGFAVVDREGKRIVDACNLGLFELIDKCRAWSAQTDGNVLVCVEAGWLNKISNFHTHSYQNTSEVRRAMRIAKNVGENHSAGKTISEGLKHYGIEHTAVEPLLKHWQGKDGKITREELALITGFNERTNQDVRDASLLAWVCANLPIRLSRDRKKSKSI